MCQACARMAVRCVDSKCGIGAHVVEKTVALNSWEYIFS